MKGKVCMVTGATSGIGQESARVLAQMGAHVIVVGRNEEKAKKSVAMIQADSGSSHVEYLIADFASLATIRQLAQRVQATYDRLDVLINNAATFQTSRGETADSIEMNFGVNHLGYFLLTMLLLDMLKASAPARIVNVSSRAHRQATMDFDDLFFEESYKGMDAYGRSKLANVLFTYKLARRLGETAVTVNALHPGFIATNLGADNVPVIGKAIKWIINLAAKDVGAGADTVVYLATSPDVADVTGKYFVNRQAVSSSELSYDEVVAQRLWQISEEMTGL